MKRIVISSFLTVIISLIFQGNLFPHGSSYTVINKAMGVQAKYSDGSAMADCEVEIFPPGSRETASKGITDSKGRIFFAPDKKGIWKLKIDDGMGHVLTAEVKPGAVTSTAGHGHGHGSLSWIQKILMVLSVAWGAAGTALYFKGRNS